jgi:RhtB (resistance to homoserine/threonine) family protein
VNRVDYLTLWLILASVNLAATVSPGPAFVLTVRSALTHNRRAGLLTALGLGLGITVHVTIVLSGFAVLISSSALLFDLLKYAGAAYLAYIGIKGVLAKKRSARNIADGLEPVKTISDVQALRIGILTNLLNPKAIVFFAAVYAQLITADTPWQILILFGLTSMIIESGWFSIVTLVLTDPRVRDKFFGISHWIERVCGGLLIALGIRLALSKGLS